MNVHLPRLACTVAAVSGLIATRPAESAAEQQAAPLPQGVNAVWDSGKAQRTTTSTRERISLNGLWQWQPGEAQSQQPPTGNWGWFKVPGSWPGITDYMQKDCQTVFAHPAWKDQKLEGITTAWYQREFTVPSDWSWMANQLAKLGFRVVKWISLLRVDREPRIC
jgi:hypothetical protein